MNLLICGETDLGRKAIVNNTHWGLIFSNDILGPITRGQHLSGFIRQVREDGKIDLSLQKPGIEKITELTDVILNQVKTQGGFLPITDKSPPREIYELFGVSKGTFKKAIGALYKKRLIIFKDNGIKLAAD